MSFENSFKKSITYLSAKDINEINSPHLKRFSIGFFGYARLYKDNSVLWLINNKDWIYHYIKNRYQLLVNTAEVETWQSAMEPKAIIDGASLFCLYNGILLKKEHEDYIEHIELASHNPYSTPLEFCYSKILLNQFIFYFKEQAKIHIQKADKKRLHFPNELSLNLNRIKTSYNKFCSLINTKKIHMHFINEDIVFSKREFEVLSLLAGGQTVKQTAKLMHLSPRTTEGYLNNAKNKTKGFTTAMLLENFRNNLF